MTRASLRRLTAGALPLLLGTSAAVAQEEGAFDRTPKDCIQVNSIDQTEAVDDQNILFHMRGKTVYRNHLPQRCPSLKREDRIAYKVYSGRLCSTDTITVLELFGGVLQPGFTCGLGDFVPLSPEEIEDFEREDERPGRAAIEAEPVDLERPAEPAADTESEPAEPAETEN
jgi:hypothetical protein